MQSRSTHLALFGGNSPEAKESLDRWLVSLEHSVMEGSESELVLYIGHLRVRGDNARMSSEGGDVEGGQPRHGLVGGSHDMGGDGQPETGTQLKRTPVIVLKPLRSSIWVLADEIYQQGGDICRSHQ